MSLSPALKNSISSVLLAFVGAIFVLKYSARILNNTGFPELCAALYSLAFLSLRTFIGKLEQNQSAHTADRHYFVAALSCLLIAALLMITLAPETNRVTRLPAIKEWIELLLARKFPWGTQTQFNPSGLPFLFIVALPFYYAGKLGYLEFVGIALYCTAVIRIHPCAQTRWLQIVTLLALPTVFFELLVRSDLFFNMLLGLMGVLLSERYLNTKKPNARFFGLASLFGLALSTRLIVAVLFTAFISYKFRQQKLLGLLFSGVVLTIFGVTLLPFILWNCPSFLAEGPFAIQLSYLPLGSATLCTVAAAFAGSKAIDLSDVLFITGVLLFILVVVAFISAAANLGFNTAVLRDGFDISYFIFCTPFLLLSQGQQNQ